MKCQTAKKQHVCDLCGQPIPIGHRYWRDYSENAHGDADRDVKQHTNCAEYETKITACEVNS